MEHLSFTATMAFHVFFTLKWDKGFFKVIPSFLPLRSHTENTLIQQIYYQTHPKQKKQKQCGRL